MIARRVRDAQADYDDERFTAAEHVLSYIANEPPTGSRQLRSTPEGVDILIGWLQEIRGEVDSRWGEYHCFKYDEATGRRSLGPTSSRVRGLTDLITRGDPRQARARRGRRHPRADGRPPGRWRDRPRGRRRAGAAARPPRHARPRPVRRQPRRGGPARHPADDKATALARKYENAAALALRPDAEAARRLPPRATPVAGRGADRGPRPPITTSPRRSASAASARAARAPARRRIGFVRAAGERRGRDRSTPPTSPSARPRRAPASPPNHRDTPPEPPGRINLDASIFPRPGRGDPPAPRGRADGRRNGGRTLDEGAEHGILVA